VLFCVLFYVNVLCTAANTIAVKYISYNYVESMQQKGKSIKINKQIKTAPSVTLACFAHAQYPLLSGVLRVPASSQGNIRHRYKNI
jgi:hypothetical protein